MEQLYKRQVSKPMQAVSDQHTRRPILPGTGAMCLIMLSLSLSWTDGTDHLISTRWLSISCEARYQFLWRGIHQAHYIGLVAIRQGVRVILLR
jgi:hypothetical protein